MRQPPGYEPAIPRTNLLTIPAENYQSQEDTPTDSSKAQERFSRLEKDIEILIPEQEGHPDAVNTHYDVRDMQMVEKAMPDLSKCDRNSEVQNHITFES